MRNVIETASGEDTTPGKISVYLDAASDSSELRVRDNGVGMTRAVVKNHLIAIASDFWHSVDFARDFGRALDFGFKPIGKFGVGFLSVFMLGDYVEVETERAGSGRVVLRLRGLGRRGEIREMAATGQIGTEVRVKLRGTVASRLDLFPEIIKARAPMLPYTVVIKTKTDHGERKVVLEPRWWLRVPSSELETFVAEWPDIAWRGKRPDKEELLRRGRVGDDTDSLGVAGWPGPKPELMADNGRVISRGRKVRGGSILNCSHGIAVSSTYNEDLVGLVEIGEAELTVDRSSLSGTGKSPEKPVIEGFIDGITPLVRESVDSIATYGMIPARYDFLRRIAEIYGLKVLEESSLGWIPVMEPPGNLLHRSRLEALKRLAKEPDVLLGVGVAPDSTYGLAAGPIPPHRLGQVLAIVLPDAGFQIDYHLRERIEVMHGKTRLRGTLEYLSQEIHVKLSEPILLKILLRLIAEAWQIEPESLGEQSWNVEADYPRASLWAHLTRP